MVAHSGQNFKYFVIHRNHSGTLPIIFILLCPYLSRIVLLSSYFHFILWCPYIASTLTKPVRIESPERKLSIVAGFVKIGIILRKIWAKHCRDQNCVIMLGHFGDFMVQFPTIFLYQKINKSRLAPVQHNDNRDWP